jgi:hypothetical protein
MHQMKRNGSFVESDFSRKSFRERRVWRRFRHVGYYRWRISQ